MIPFMKPVGVGLAAIVFASVAAQGQGQFSFNAHSLTIGNDVQFALASYCSLPNYPQYFLQVSAGQAEGQFKPLIPVLPLHLTGAGPVYPEPSSQVYTVPGLPAGTAVIVLYNVIAGESLDHISVSEGDHFAIEPVILAEAPATAPEVLLGNRMVTVFYCPEPAPLSLAAIASALAGGAIFSTLRRGRDPVSVGRCPPSAALGMRLRVTRGQASGSNVGVLHKPVQENSP